MKLAEVAFVLTCPKCGAEWLPHDEERWRAYLGCDEDLEEPAELFFYCRPAQRASSAVTRNKFS